MRYLLDTNTCIALLNKKPTTPASKLSSIPRHDVFLCRIVQGELFFGAYRSSRREENLERLLRFFAEFDILPFDQLAAEIYGKIRSDLAARGTPIGPNDLQIAAIAIASNVRLVTHNTSEYSRVHGLVLEDWK